MQLIMIRRAGCGWIAATYDGAGRCLDLIGGQWPTILSLVLGAAAATSALGGGGQEPEGGGIGLDARTDRGQ